MSRTRILIDGSTDMPVELIDKYKIEIIPLNVSFGQDSYVSGVDLDNKTFYERMKKESELPKTSCPSPERFIEAYKKDGDIIMFTLTSKLSATYSTACLALAMFEEEYKDHGKKIIIIDSDQGSIGAGLMAFKAAKMLEDGISIEEIEKRAEVWKKEIIHFGALETLDNAIKGGRVNKVAGMIINALSFKAIVHIYDGAVKPVDKARGEINSLKKVVDLISKELDDKEDKSLWIAHANSPEKIETVKNMLDLKIKYVDCQVAEVGPVMGTYAAEGAILVALL